MIVEILLPARLFERTRYRLIKPLELAGVVVPAGFVTDGASVPRPLWPLFPPTGRYFAAAVVHDWLLSNGCGWRMANQCFRRALQQQGLPFWVVASMYWSVQTYQFVKEILRAGTGRN